MSLLLPVFSTSSINKCYSNSIKKCDTIQAKEEIPFVVKLGQTDVKRDESIYEGSKLQPQSAIS